MAQRPDWNRHKLYSSQRLPLGQEEKQVKGTEWIEGATEAKRAYESSSERNPTSHPEREIEALEMFRRPRFVANASMRFLPNLKDYLARKLKEMRCAVGVGWLNFCTAMGCAFFYHLFRLFISQQTRSFLSLW